MNYLCKKVKRGAMKKLKEELFELKTHLTQQILVIYEQFNFSIKI
jgi:hypothetical protein